MSDRIDLQEKLSFIDGYLFRVMLEMLMSDGLEESGFYDFYGRRIEQQLRALSWYDKEVVGYITKRFDREKRRILHVGIGVGTLTAALAITGYVIGGIERDGRRYRAATRIREAVAEAWPKTAERYSLIHGEFPTTVIETPWMGRDVILIFTNCVATWSGDLTEKIITSLSRFGDVLLDLRQFGRLREDPMERAELVGLIERQGLIVTPIAKMLQRSSYYCHIGPA
jgi:hypothetical protein